MRSETLDELLNTIGSAEHVASRRRGDPEHDQIRIAPSCSSDRSARTSIPGLKVVASSVTTEPINHVYEPLFGLVVQGAKRILLGDRMLDYGAGQYLVVSVDLPITSHIDVASAEEPFLSIGLMSKPAEITTLLLDAATNDRAAVVPSGIGVSEAPVELLEAIGFLACIRIAADRPGLLVQWPAMIPLRI